MKYNDIIKKFGKNYFYSSLFLPANIRQDVITLYAFMRFFDDIVDEENDINKFNQYKKELAKTFSGLNLENTLFNDVFNIIKKYNLDKNYFIDFIKSMESDFHKKRYKSWEELNEYIYGSAEVMGLILAKIFGVYNNEAFNYARKLGYAMQMTNFLRDLGEDYQKRGRIYFPEEELKKFNLTEEDISNKKINFKLISFNKSQISKIRELYKEANRGIKLITNLRCRLAVILASNLYSNILNKIKQNGYDNLNKRNYNNKLDFILITIKSLLQLIFKY